MWLQCKCQIIVIVFIILNVCFQSEACSKKVVKEPCQNVKKASVMMTGGTVKGTLTLTAVGGKVRVIGELTGIKPTGGATKVGFHVHQYGDLSDDCKAAGGHYNPHGKTHGGPTDSVRHVGDLGNIEVTGGKATIDITDSVIKLSGEYSIVGRAFVVHSGTDDLGKVDNEGSKKTGNAGARIGCGVVIIPA